MIDANELRVGNVITLLGYDIHEDGSRVQDVEGDEIFLISKLKELVEIENDSYSYYPVRLTPEILIKSGFKIRYDELWECETVEIEKQGNGYILLNGEGKSAWNRVYLYLHELQNIYYWLTGEELEIKL